MAYEVIRFVLATIVLSFLTVDAAYPKSCPTGYVEAVCNLKTNRNVQGLARQIEGRVIFRQNVTKDCRRRMNLLKIHTEIRGLIEDDGTDYHAMHVHESNDTSHGCDSMGPHFNPLNAQHGARTDSLEMRHVGDFGNLGKFINTDLGGYISDVRTDYLLNLVGRDSIIGRGLVLREYKDDLGLGGDDKSLEDGNTGWRLACCVIEPSSS